MAANDAFFLYTHAGGLVIEAEGDVEGDKLLLQNKRPTTDPLVSQQLFTLRGGTMTHQASGYVVDYYSGAVMLRTFDPNSITQRWAIDSEYRVTSPGVPGLVMRGTRSNPTQNFYSPGAQVIMATDTPYYPDEQVQFRRWFQLLPAQTRSIFGLAGETLGTSLSQPAVSDGSPGQLWYPDPMGMFVNDEQGACLYVTGGQGGRPYRTLGLGKPFFMSDGPYQFTVDRAALTVGNPPSNTLQVFIPGRAPNGAIEYWPAGEYGMDYRWCYGNGPDWIRVPGDFLDLSVGSDGVVGAVTKDNHVVCYAGGGQWIAVPGDPVGAVDLSLGNRTTIWYLNAAGAMFRFTGLAPTYWEQVAGPAMAYLSVAQTGTAWAIDRTNRILRYTGYDWELITPEWQEHTGQIDQISTTSEQEVWATGKDGRIWWYDNATRSWEQVPGNLDRVSAGADGTAWGVTAKSMTYEYVGEPDLEWQQVPTLFNRCAVGSARYIWAMGPGGVFRRDPNLPGSGTAPTVAAHETVARTHAAPSAAAGLKAPAVRTQTPPPAFAPTASDVNEAILCANMASASYGDEEAVRAEIAQYGYTLDRFFDVASTGTQGFLAHNDAAKSIVLAFRGTSEMQDANLDLWQEMATVSELGPEVKVVQGFDIAYTSVEDEVMNAVNALMSTGDRLATTQRFFVTGHSLGGGLATMASLQMAQLLKVKGRSGLVRGITFAAPAIGNPGFRDYYLSQTHMFAAIAYVDQYDSVATGKWTVAPGVVIDLEAWGYVPPVPSIYVFDDPTPMPQCHLMATYQRLLGELAQREDSIHEVRVEITTGTASVAPWWKFDTPGTSREISITLGQPTQDTSGDTGGRIQQILRPADDDWDHDGTGTETGQRTTFAINNTLGLTQGDLKQFTITINVSSGGLINWDLDNWDLDGVKIIADGIVRYDKQHLNKLLGPDYNSSFTDSIAALPRPGGSRHGE